MTAGPTTLAVGIALLGAACYAAGAALQHQQAAAVPAGTGLRPTLLLRLARQPKWLFGGIANAAGAGLHVIALTLAPLAIVQPIGVMTIVFAVPSAALLTRRRPSKLELTGAILASVGLVLLVTAIRSPRAAPVLGFAEVVPVALGLVVLLAGIALLVRLLRGVVRSIVLAAAGGVAFGVMSAIMRPALTDIGERGLAGLISWSVLAVGVLALVGVLLEQSAFQTGRLAIAIAVVVITDPLASIVFGATLFHQPVGVEGIGLAIGGTLLVLLGIGVLALKRTPVPPGPGDPADAERRRTAVREASSPNAEHAEAAGLRILIGADAYLPHVGGTEYFTRQLAQGLAALGHEVHLVCPSTSWRGRVEDDGPVRVHRVCALPTLVERTFWFASPLYVGEEIERIVDEVRPDVVHVQGHYLVGRALCRVARRTGVPLVATNHFMPENLPAYLSLPGPLARLVSAGLWRDVARVFAPAATVTTPTPRAAQLVKSAGGLLDVQPVSNGIDLTRFAAATATGSPAPPAAAGQRTMLFVGRLVPEKHVHELIDALVTVRRDVDARLVIAGTGPLEETLRRRAAARGVAGHVRFLGHVPDDDLPALYASADVFCMPGTAELQSLVLLEAMATGRPVVAADAMALPHLCRHGYNGFLHDPHDVADVAARVTAILSDDVLRARMGAASLTIAAQHAQDRTLLRYEQIYAAAAGTPIPARVVGSPAAVLA